jgi:tRNA A22 N-methylase
MARELSMLQMDRNIHTKLKAYCKTKGMTIGPFVDKLVTDFLDNRLEAEMIEYSQKKIKLQQETLKLLKELRDELSAD